MDHDFKVDRRDCRSSVEESGGRLHRSRRDDDAGGEEGVLWVMFTWSHGGWRQTQIIYAAGWRLAGAFVLYYSYIIRITYVGISTTT